MEGLGERGATHERDGVRETARAGVRVRARVRREGGAMHE